MDTGADDSSAGKKSHRSAAGRIAAVASALLWTGGILLAFCLPPSSSAIWVPDALLLAGFVPLLFFWRWSWPWLVFGLFNIGIGFLLQVIEYLPDSHFPADLVRAKKHLADYHEPFTWMVIGLLASLYGLGRLLKNIVLWAYKRNPRSTELSQSSRENEN